MITGAGEAAADALASGRETIHSAELGAMAPAVLPRTLDGAARAGYTRGAMGIWTWLDRHERAPFERAAGGAASDAWIEEFYSGAPESSLGHVAGMHTHRVWHALHVALTGEEEGGLAPACYVVWTTSGAHAVSMTSAGFMHTAETVREVADYLRGLDEQQVIDDLYAAQKLGACVYSFNHWRGELDMVESGAFQQVFRDVVAFYAAAASAGQVIVVQRG